MNLNIQKNIFDSDYSFLLLARDNEFIKAYTFVNESLIQIVLDKKGNYCLETYVSNDDNIMYYIYPFDKMIEEIDFSKKYYSGSFKNDKFSFYSNDDFSYYKVSNLKEDKLVYFTSEKDWNFNLYFIFEEIKSGDTTQYINSFDFLKGEEYKISFNLLSSINAFPNRKIKYNFFQIFEDTIQNRKKDIILLILLKYLSWKIIKNFILMSSM